MAQHKLKGILFHPHTFYSTCQPGVDLSDIIGGFINTVWGKELENRSVAFFLVGTEDLELVAWRGVDAAEQAHLRSLFSGHEGKERAQSRAFWEQSHHLKLFGKTWRALPLKRPHSPFVALLQQDEANLTDEIIGAVLYETPPEEPVVNLPDIQRACGVFSTWMMLNYFHEKSTFFEQEHSRSNREKSLLQKRLDRVHIDQCIEDACQLRGDEFYERMAQIASLFFRAPVRLQIRSSDGVDEAFEPDLFSSSNFQSFSYKGPFKSSSEDQEPIIVIYEQKKIAYLFIERTLEELENTRFLDSETVKVFLEKLASVIDERQGMHATISHRVSAAHENSQPSTG